MANIDKRTRKNDSSSETIYRNITSDNDLITSEHDRWGIFDTHWIVWRPARRVILTIATWNSADEDADGVPSDFQKKTIVLPRADGPEGDAYRAYMREDAATVGDKLRLLTGTAARKAARNHSPKLIPPAPQCTDIDEPNPDPE